MTIHIIHKPERQDRLVLLNSEIAEHQLQVKIWPAIVDEVRTFRGINLAHKQIVRWARDSQLPMVCIGEDDLHITGKGAWQFFIRHIPDNFDLYLSGVYCGHIKTDKTIDDFCGLHLYVVHQRFYDCFLGVNEMENLDRALARRGRFVVSDPFCAVQHAGFSDHKNKYAEYSHILKSAGRRMCCEGIPPSGPLDHP